MAFARKCIICFENYDRGQRKPVGLPCGHTLCQDCMNSEAATCCLCAHPSSNGGNTCQMPGCYRRKRTCPTCREPVPDWSLLRPNWGLIQLLEETTSAERSGSDRLVSVLSETLSGGQASAVSGSGALTASSSGSTTTQQQVEQQSLPDMVAALKGTDTTQQLSALQALEAMTLPSTDPADSSSTPSAPGTGQQTPDVGCAQVFSAGGLDALLSLLTAAVNDNNTVSSSSSSQVTGLALKVLCQLMLHHTGGTSDQRQQAVVAAGAVPLLAQLVNSSDPGTSGFAEAALQILQSSEQESIRNAAGQQVALPLLQDMDSRKQLAGLGLLRVLFAEGDAVAALPPSLITSLTQLLGSFDEEVQHSAVKLLHTIARDATRVADIMRANAVAPLVSMMHNTHLQEDAVCALRRMASNSMRSGAQTAATPAGIVPIPSAVVQQLCREGALRAVVLMLRDSLSNSSSSTPAGLQHAVHLLYRCSCVDPNAARVISVSGGRQVLEPLLHHQDVGVRDTAAAALHYIP